MKDFMVFLAFIVLGVFIASLIWSDNDGSLKTITKGLMEQQVNALGS